MQEYLKSAHIRKTEDTDRVCIEWGIKHLFVALWDNLVPLIKANLCFLLLCVPIITIPTAIYAMSKVCIESIRGRQVSVLKVFLHVLKNDFCISQKMVITLGSILGVSLVGIVFYFRHAEQTMLLGIAGMILTVIAVITYLMIPYCLSMAVITPLTYGQIMKNALLLTILNIKFSIMGGVTSFALAVLQFVFCMRLFPLTIIVGLSLIFYFEIYCALFGLEQFVLTEKL